MKRTTALLVSLALVPGSFAVEVSVDHTDPTCGMCNGTAEATVSGGLPPYSFTWSPAPPSGQGTANVAGLCAGTWTVDVTDGVGGTATASFTVVDLPGLSPWIPTQVILTPCQMACSGWVTIHEDDLGGTPPYSYSYGMVDYTLMGPGSVTFQGLCPGQTIIDITDGNGCTGSVQIDLLEQWPTPMYLYDVHPACGGQSNGVIIVSGPGDVMTYQVISEGGFDSTYVFSDYNSHIIEGLPPGDYTVTGMTDPPWGGMQLVPVWCAEVVQATVGSIPEPCGLVSGTMFHDVDQDCLLNGFDVTMPYHVLSIEPGNQYTITNASGHYARGLAYGNYTIDEGVLADTDPVCPAAGSAALALDDLTPQVVVDFANFSTIPHDLSVHIASTEARPGFPTQAWITVTNISAFPSGDVTLELVFDPLLLNPSITGLVDLDVIGPYGSATAHFTADVPSDLGLLGTVITYTVTETNTATESNSSNNSASLAVTITGSFDPNDKQGHTSSSLSSTQYFLDEDEWLDYTIRFQNTGTAAAETVVIRDTIDADLDVFALHILGSSHPFTPSFGDGRELVFTFDDINLPDSATDLAGSQGFISYRMTPLGNVVVGALLKNAAGIYFDFNPPIITDEVVHVVELSTSVQDGSPGRVQVTPNPAEDQVQVVTNDAGTQVLAVCTVEGRRVDIPITRSTSGTVLDIGRLPAGLYTVHTTSGSARFVKP